MKKLRRFFCFMLSFILLLTSHVFVRADNTRYSSSVFTMADFMPFAAAFGTVHCYVCIGNEWVLADTIEIAGRDGNNKKGRYYVTQDQLEGVYSAYGFTAGTYQASQKPFPYAVTGGQELYVDAMLGNNIKVNGETAVPLGPVTDNEFDLYYTPNFNKASSSNTGIGRDDPSLASFNSFYKVTIADPDGLAGGQVKESVSYLLAGSSKELLLPTINRAEWYCSSASATKTENGDGVLYQIDRISEHIQFTVVPNILKLTLRVNGFSTDFEVTKGTGLAGWLAGHGDDPFQPDPDDSLHTAIRCFEWRLGPDFQTGAYINGDTAAVTDVVLSGSPRDLVTVQFYAVKPGAVDPEYFGGTFIDQDKESTSVTLFQGDCITEGSFRDIRKNLKVNGTYIFDGWYYLSGNGDLNVTPTTQITQDMAAYALYRTNATYTFFTDRNMTDIIPGGVVKKLKIGEPYPYAAPQVEPPAGKVFRYWVDATHNKVFSEQDTVLGDASLYPVFDRYIFSFRNPEDNTAYFSIYEGDTLKELPGVPDGFYCSGYRITDSYGNSIFLQKGAVVSADVLAKSGVIANLGEDGRYVLYAEPVFEKRYHIVYHSGEDGSLVNTDTPDGDTYTETVDNHITLLGSMDISNTMSETGLGLAGWGLSEDGKIAFQPYEALDEQDLSSADADGDKTLHLWPVWTQKENTLRVTFHVNYPVGPSGDWIADGADGGKLDPGKTYVVYIKNGSSPLLPDPSRFGMELPVNALADGTGRFVFAGWSVVKAGNGDGNSTSQGTYSVNSQYASQVTKDIDFYGIWVDRSISDSQLGASFFIRLDGTLPLEPGGYAESGYAPSNHSDLRGILRSPKGIVNDPDRVAANIKEQPSVSAILAVLKREMDANAKNPNFSILRSKWDTMTEDAYGKDKEWWIEWYACKPMPGEACGYHVDGRIRFSDQVELNYHSNGGTNAVPVGMVCERGADVLVVYKNGSGSYPERSNFTFIGWAEDRDALIPTYWRPDYPERPSASETSIQMDVNRDLYAVWLPNTTTIPLNGAFSGMKFELDQYGEQKAASEDGKYHFTMKLTEKPDGVPGWEREAINKGDGTFSFGQMSVSTAGRYVFEIKETRGTDRTIQYDSSVYKLTVRIALSEYGLGINGYSFSKNGKDIPSAGNSSLREAVFQFVNKIGVRDVSVTKQWDDKDDQDGKRPDSIEVALLQDGMPVGVQELNGGNNWSYTWAGLPTTNTASNMAYAYSVIETSVPVGYLSGTAGNMDTGFTVTNSYTPKTCTVPIRKEWEDNSNAFLTRPEHVSFVLSGYAQGMNGEKVGDAIWEEELTLSGQDGWEGEFTDVPVYSGGELLLYELKETTSCPYYQASIDKTMYYDYSWAYTVTNTLCFSDIAVTKKVTGEMGDHSRKFKFLAKLVAKNGETLPFPDAGQASVDGSGTAHFSLSDGESILLTGIPQGSMLYIEEEGMGYQVRFSDTGRLGSEYDGNSATFDTTDTGHILVTNHSIGIPGTGVADSPIPFIALLLFGLGTAFIVNYSWRCQELHHGRRVVIPQAQGELIRIQQARLSPAG